MIVKIQLDSTIYPDSDNYLSACKGHQESNKNSSPIPKVNANAGQAKPLNRLTNCTRKI